MSAGTEGMAEPQDAERSLAEARATGDPRTIGGAEAYLGASYLAHGRGPEALESLSAAERTFAAAGLDREAAISRINVARCLSEIGRGDEAVALYQAVAAEQADIDRGLATEARSGLVDHYELIGDPGRGPALLQEEARRLESEGRPGAAADVLMVEGSAHHKAGELHQAADCFTRAAAAYDAAGEEQWATNARHNLGVVNSG
jgi:tetratricopeptide (TPR) repeat protein